MIEKVRNIFKNDKFATQNGAYIEEIGDKTATCSLVIKDIHLNAMGSVMGGTYFMLADFAFAVASNWQNMNCVSLRSDISFLGAPKGKKLIAKATCIKDGKTVATYRIDVTDELGTLTATVLTTGYHVQK